jgi:hypothetical protein
MSRIHWQAHPVGKRARAIPPALRRVALLGSLALALAGVALAAAALLATSALAATPIALDAPDNGQPPLIAYDPTTLTTYVAWSDPVKLGVDLCVLPANATACSGGAPVVLEDSHYGGWSELNHPGLGGLVVLPGGEAVVIGTPVSTGSVAWASAPGGAGFLSGSHGLQNGGHFISPVSLFYTFGNAAALGDSDVALLDDFDHFYSFFSDSPFAGPESPPISEKGNSNPGGLYPTKGQGTDGPDIAAEPAPAPAPAGTDVVVGVGDNYGGPSEALPGCLNKEGSGYGVSVGKVDGTSNAAGTLNHAGLPAYKVLACSALSPVLAQGGEAGIGVLEQEGSGISGAGSQYTVDYRPFHATAEGSKFGEPVELANVTGETLDGVIDIDLAEDSGTGVYATWVDFQGLVLDYSADGGEKWEGPTVDPEPASGPQGGPVIVGTGGGNAEIAYTGNTGIGTQVFLQSVNYAALVAANAVSPITKTTTTTTTTPTEPPVVTPPNSDYTVSSIVVNSNGTVTITFVPTQSGEAVLVVTVPTASIASTAATAAKAKKCKHGQIKIKGKCLPENTVSGKTTAHGTAGVPLKLKVTLSSKVKAQLDKGKTVHVTATLTYTSSLGGKATVHTYHLTIKGVKSKKK